MKLKNKHTGEIATLTLSSNGEDMIIMGNDMYAHITKLSELKDYEDYEEPKEYWTIDGHGKVHEIFVHSKFIDEEKEIGNYFDTREEAELAVRKLKAWKRLKDNGVYYSLGYMLKENTTFVKLHCKKEGFTFDQADILYKDLELLFGGEE